MPSDWALRHSSNASKGSRLSAQAFISKDLQVLTAFSALPLLCV